MKYGFIRSYRNEEKERSHFFKWLFLFGIILFVFFIITVKTANAQMCYLDHPYSLGGEEEGTSTVGTRSTGGQTDRLKFWFYVPYTLNELRIDIALPEGTAWQGGIGYDLVQLEAPWLTRISPETNSWEDALNEDLAWPDLPGNPTSHTYIFGNVASGWYQLVYRLGSASIQNVFYNSATNTPPLADSFQAKITVQSNSYTTIDGHVAGIRFTTDTAEPQPINLTYPVPLSSNLPVYLNEVYWAQDENEIWQQYTFKNVNITGTCLTNGEDRILISQKPYTHVPTSTDFTTLQGDWSYLLDCENNVWNKVIPVFKGINDFTVWAKDFIDEERSPTNNYDFQSGTLIGVDVMSFPDPNEIDLSEFFLSDNPFIQNYCQDIDPLFSLAWRDFNFDVTILPDITFSVPYLQFGNLKEWGNCLTIGDLKNATDYFDETQKYIQNEKIPWAYWYQFKNEWDEREEYVMPKVEIKGSVLPVATDNDDFNTSTLEILDWEKFRYENLTEKYQDIVDWIEDKPLKWLIIGFLVWFIIRILYIITK